MAKKAWRWKDKKKKKKKQSLASTRWESTNSGREWNTNIRVKDL